MPDPRPSVPQTRPSGWTWLDYAIEEFLDDLKYGYTYGDLSLVYVDGEIHRWRLEEKYTGGYFNVKVTKETLELLKERKKMARGILGGYDVYDIRRDWVQGPYRGLGRARWLALLSKAYFNRDFVENTGVIRKHLEGREAQYGIRHYARGIDATPGRAKQTTTLGVSLREELQSLRSEHGYTGIDHLLRAILEYGGEYYQGYLKELRGEVESKIKTKFGPRGKMGWRKYVTPEAYAFLYEYYK